METYVSNKPTIIVIRVDTKTLRIVINKLKKKSKPTTGIIFWSMALK